MKKLVPLFLAVVLCLTLAACGGVDKQPAVDAHNAAGAAINELSAVLNADPATYAQQIEQMNAIVSQLNEIGEQLGDSSVELTQEQVDAYVENCNQLAEWANQAKAALEG